MATPKAGKKQWPLGEVVKLKGEGLLAVADRDERAVERVRIGIRRGAKAGPELRR